MSIALRCQCGKAITVPEKHAGMKIRCRECRRTMVVPGVRWGSRVTYLAWGTFAATCVLAVLLWQLGDVWWPMTLLLFMGRWILLIPIGVLAIAALILRRRALVPVVLSAIVVAGPIMGFRVGWQRLIPHAAGMRIRVVSVNADQRALGAGGVHDLLERVRPDVVAIQECGPLLVTQLEQVEGWYHHQTRDLCFLSRFPITDSSLMDRRVLARIHGDGGESIGGAGYVVRYTVQAPEGAVNVTNLHLETPRKGLEELRAGTFDLDPLRENTTLRGIESGLARQFVNQGTHPAIVLGDFNTPVESRIFQSSWGDLTDAFSYAGFGFGMTKFNGWIRARIDHVLAGPGVYVDRAAVGDDVDSDHRPLVVDLTITPESAPRGNPRRP